MSTNAKHADEHEDRQPGIQTRVVAWVTRKEHAHRPEVGEVCRLTVVGPAAGPASRPPRVSLYVGNGTGEDTGGGPGRTDRDRLRPDEASRCWTGLREGDLIEAFGDLGPEREKSGRQEVIVSRRVILRARLAEAV